MKAPIINQATLDASARVYSRSFTVVRNRNIGITWRCTFPSSGAGNATGECYFSHDGINWDTIIYGSATLTLTADTAVQLTATVVAPAHGFIRFALLNSNANPVTDVKAWCSLDLWEPSEKAPPFNNPETRFGEEEYVG